MVLLGQNSQRSDVYLIAQKSPITTQMNNLLAGIVSSRTISGD